MAKLATRKRAIRKEARPVPDKYGICEFSLQNRQNYKTQLYTHSQDKVNRDQTVKIALPESPDTIAYLLNDDSRADRGRFAGARDGAVGMELANGDDFLPPQLYANGILDSNAER